MKIFDDLVRRGLVKQTTGADKIRDLLEPDETQTFYIGFDPTADSLHVGHLLQVITAKRLSMAGHRAIILVGGATALVGDPSGKTDMRKMLSRSDIRVNSETIAKQIRGIIDDNTIEMSNNLEWFEGIHYLEFIRDIGRHFSVNNMLRADCFKSRMENGSLSFLEFNYMLMQAADFHWLFKTKNCRLQIGGDDQWSNILAGIDLVRKINEGQEIFGLTLPLLVNSDGTKMGKTEKGAVWLDPNKTSPFDFFQFWRNIPDDKVRDYVNMFTFIEPDTFETQFSNINQAKKFLAFEVTVLVHGKESALQVLERAEALFENQDASQLEILPIEDGMPILDVIVKCGFAKSKNQARDLIRGKGITINQEVVDEPTVSINYFVTLLRSNDLILRKGKKHFQRLLIGNKWHDQIP